MALKRSKKNIAASAKRKADNASRRTSSSGSSRTVDTSPQGIKNTLARSSAMLAQTKAEGSKAFKGSSYERDYKNAITSDMVKPATAIKIPDKAQVTDPGSLNLAGTPVLNQNGITVENNQYVTDPEKSETGNAVAEANFNNQQSLQDYIANVTDAQKATRNSEADYLKRERKAGIEGFQQSVNDYTAQLNTIAKNRDADILRVEGQGRGIPEAIIGGQQAKINREAAIASLPVSAQLDAAQGNLDSATARLDKLFSMHREDVKNEFEFKSSLFKSALDFANSAEANVLQGKLSDISAKTAKENANLDRMNEWAKLAISTGQGNLISQFTGLDPTSENFNIEFGKLQGLVREPVAASSGSIKAPEIKNFGTSDSPDWRQYNSQTGSWDTVSGVGGGQGSGQGFQDSGTTERKYTSLLNDIGVAKGLAEGGAVGAGWIERGLKKAFSSNPDFEQLQNISDTIKTNVLLMNTDPAIKKFFGPQMSERDVELMTGAGTTLDSNKQSKVEYVKDLQDAADLIVRARSAVRSGMQADVGNTAGLRAPVAERLGIITAPDGRKIIITD